MVENAKERQTMDALHLSFLNVLERHFSSFTKVSKITVMKWMLRLHLKAMKYSLILHYGITRGT